MCVCVVRDYVDEYEGEIRVVLLGSKNCGTECVIYVIHGMLSNEGRVGVTAVSALAGHHPLGCCFIAANTSRR